MKKIISALLTLAVVTVAFASCGVLSTILRGTTVSDTYTNESVGIKFTKPEDWVFLSEEELAELSGMTAEMYKDEKIMESAEITSITEFMAMNELTGSNVVMVIENLVPSGSVGITEKEYAEASKQLMETQLNADCTFGDTKEVTLGGAEFLLMDMTMEYSGVAVEQQYYMRKVDHYMVVITATNMDADDVADMFS